MPEPEPEVMDELTALRTAIEAHGFEILTEGAPYHRSDGKWSPVAIRVKDPAKVLKAVLHVLEPHGWQTALERRRRT